MSQRELVQATIDATPPLTHPRGGRLPLYLWQLHGLGTDNPAEMTSLLKALDARGLAAFASWNPRSADKSLADALRLGRLQQQLGLDVNLNATNCLSWFYDGSEPTAHIDAEGKPFFDLSFDPNRKIGCPFTLAPRHEPVRKQLEFFLDAYRREGVTPKLIFTDWEIDGPIEWNDAWAAAKRCTRCREHIARLDDFAAFQAAYRTIRSDLQRACLARPVLDRFPHCLVGNYAVYPNDGWRYWYDYFEHVPGPEVPIRREQQAVYRPWAQEFAGTGFTFAMPVTYTWYPIFSWYDFANTDYRWFHALLKAGTNAASCTPANVPVIDFVHWHTTSPPPNPDPAVQPMSAGAYQELLWHLLLRGVDALFLWSPREEAIEETRLLHQVYAESLAYGEFLEHGQPISFANPDQPGPVVSGLRLGNRVLVRRSDFTAQRAAVVLTVDGHRLVVPRMEGKCQVMALR